MSKEKREFSPMKGVFPDPSKIMCKDCEYRDKTQISIGSNIMNVGVTKAFCEMFPKGGESNGKPYDILFQNAKCGFYLKDKGNE